MFKRFCQGGDKFRLAVSAPGVREIPGRPVKLPEMPLGEQQGAPFKKGDDIVANSQRGTVFAAWRYFITGEQTVSRADDNGGIQ